MTHSGLFISAGHTLRTCPHGRPTPALRQIARLSLLAFPDVHTCACEKPLRSARNLLRNSSISDYVHRFLYSVPLRFKSFSQIAAKCYKVKLHVAFNPVCPAENARLFEISCDHIVLHIGFFRKLKNIIYILYRQKQEKV